jgi:hypothetical protein
LLCAKSEESKQRWISLLNQAIEMVQKEKKRNCLFPLKRNENKKKGEQTV